MDSSDLNLEKLFDTSRFDYSEWMQRAAGEGDSCGSAAIQSLVSTYDIFSQLRTNFASNGATSSYGMFTDPIDGHGQNFNSVNAGRSVFESAPTDTYDEREEELDDGRITLRESYDSTCISYDDVADNFQTEGGNEHAKAKKRGGRRHRSNMMKRPMALAAIIMELLDVEKRENALRCLSGHLIEVDQIRSKFNEFLQDVVEERNRHYLLQHRSLSALLLVQHACNSHPGARILVAERSCNEEVITVYDRIYANDLNIRGSKRLANVLTCFQAIASSEETRNPFVRAKIPNLLQPFIMSTFTEEVYENVRAISLSVIDLTCKGCEREVIQWALESDIVQACLHAIEIGSRLSKLIAMSILESILHDELALAVMCTSECNLVRDVVQMLSYLAAILGVVQDFSRRLIFQVIRCYTLLCQHPRALELVRDNFPEQLQDRTFHELKKVYPLFRILLHQLLLCIGKLDTHLPQISASDSENLTTPTTTSRAYDKENRSSESSLNKPSSRTPRSSSTKKSPNTPRSVDSPLRPLDLNKEGWYNLPDRFEYVPLVLGMDED